MRDASAGSSCAFVSTATAKLSRRSPASSRTATDLEAVEQTDQHFSHRHGLRIQRAEVERCRDVGDIAYCRGDQDTLF